MKIVNQIHINSKFLLIVIFTILLGCKSLPIPFNALYNKKINVVSSTNPYIASNLFLSYYAERSRNLRNFFDTRGVPLAIEVNNGVHNNPIITMYYPTSAEKYLAEKGYLNSTKNQLDWLITGPTVIERKEYILLKKLLRKMWYEPPLLIFGKSETFVSPERPTPTPLPTINWYKPSKEKYYKPLKPKIKNSPIPKPLNFDQESLQFSKSETAKDIKHIVKGFNEKLSDIVAIYTSNPKSLEKVAKINNLSKDSVLVVGDTILIPSDL
jgi:hypothetical protein